MGYITATYLAWGVGWQEVLIIGLIVLLLFGGKKIPELARGLAKGLKSFKSEMNDVKDSIDDATDVSSSNAKPSKPKADVEEDTPEDSKS